MKMLKPFCAGILTISVIGLTPFAANADTRPSDIALGNEVAVSEAPADWVDGLNPEFDPSEHVGETLLAGTSFETAKVIGQVGVAEVSDKPQMGTFSVPLDPTDWAVCDVGGDANRVLGTIYTWPFTNAGENLWWGGDVDLLCGTPSTSGWKHIRDRHQYDSPGHPNSYEDVRGVFYKLTGNLPSAPWDFYMWEAVTATLDQPEHPIMVNKSEQKTCFHAPYRIFTGNGQVVAWWTNNVILSRNNFTIITAFFSDNTGQHDCYRWNG
ncbi:hypothetical protein [uncultured Microbacterium sp.]|uniref:hypothetical protein n=1 Tax=uncultured Microbacterium sp. TaxID=191216 RepID=UPI0025CBBFE6|nr:hypothetical protein [uncultured Microbacterium sp.]